MAFELEALVGHLYIAGGRTIRTNPPGALVEVAPRTAARGREIDTFFALVLPSGTIAPNTFYEQMALMAAEQYFSNGGSVTSNLREVFNALNNNLYEHNAGGHKHYEANMLLAVMRGEELFVARAGAAAMVLRHNGQTITLPEVLTDDDALFKPPLGVQPIPDVEMKKYSINSGTRMLMTDASLAEITAAKMDQALVAEDIERMLDDFKALVTLQIQMTAVEFVPPDESVLVPAATGQSTAVLQAEIAAARSKLAPKTIITPSGETVVEKPPKENPLQKRAKNTTVSVSRSAGHSLMAIGDILQKVFGGNNPEESKSRNPIMTGLVFGMPLLLIFGVIMSWVGGVGETAFEECVGRALDAANLARSIDSSNPSSVLTAWQGTLQIVQEDCESILSENNDPTLAALRQEAIRVIDGINDITRRNASQLHVFPSGANIERIILQGLDMYVLDTANNLVYRLALAGNGQSLASLPQPITSMRTGATVDGFSVGRIVDIDFDTERTRITALDEAGVLLSCRPQFINECDAQRLVGSEQWVNPISIDLWRGRMYLLDSGSEQLWRYDPTGDRFPAAPAEYFRDALRPAMGNAVDFDISDNGTVYILTADGLMRSYFQGEPQNFQFRDFRPGQELGTVGADAMYLSNNPIAQVFLVASRRARTIYETTLGGTHMFTYRIQDESNFERLNDVTADVSQRLVYAASGNTVFVFNKEG